MSTLTITLHDGKQYTRTLQSYDERMQWNAMLLIIQENIRPIEIKSIWVQPTPIRITLEDLGITA